MVNNCFYVDISLNKLLGCWNWVCTKNGPDKEFICCRIAENEVEIKFKESGYDSVGHTFVVNGMNIRYISTRRHVGTFTEDGSIVFHTKDNPTSPVAFWSRKG